MAKPPRGVRSRVAKAGRPVRSERPRKGRGREFVYTTLRQRIVSLALPPGEEVDESALVAELGVSRTPLREALVELAGEGLVVLMPNRGARVAPLDLSHVQEHLEAFDLMQRVATSWAAARRSEADTERIAKLAEEFERALARGDSLAMTEANFRFHEAIAHACGNPTVAKFYVRLLSEGLRIARLAMAYECYGSAEAFEAHLDKIVREHRGMVEAIKAGDVETAESLAASHSGLARKRVLEYLSVSMVDRIKLRGMLSAA